MSDLIRGGVADSDGRLLPGDQILSINGDDVRAASQGHVQDLLQVRGLTRNTECVGGDSYLFCITSPVTLLSGMQRSGPPGGGSF